MGAGVPAGANRAYELSATSDGKPASAVVGISGMMALRRGLVTASATDPPHPLTLLRARRERPRRCRAAEQTDEVAPPHHSITSSARASSMSGTVRPRAFAVLRLIANSYLVGACTGRS